MLTMRLKEFLHKLLWVEYNTLSPQFNSLSNLLSDSFRAYHKSLLLRFKVKIIQISPKKYMRKS